ncbi:discoidin domain-containing protein, partial [Actinoplanes sp. NPDC051475]|uniref:discoidin domain-containing protein n=1 Tax=Actinoplanes sp. NPDC051475 TaxID=3157225 RepID=UPI00344DD3D6
GLPQPLRAVVGLALAKDPRDRPSARELLDMLLGDRPVPRPVAAPPAPGGRKLVTALAALLIVAGLTIVGLVVAATRDLRPATSSPQAAANSTPVPSPPARSPSPPSAPPLTRPATPAGSPTPAKAVPNPGRRNLALHRPVSASSSEGAAWGPENAVDGDRDTRWSSGFSDPQWLTVDLGGRRLLSEIRLSWEHAYAESYRVEISTDGRRWKQLYATADGWGGDLTIDAEQTPGRYVRVYGTRRSSRYGYSLFELEVR